MLKINIFIILAFLFSFSLYSTENTPVVFSEMTVDVAPGDDGSWIELYNRSNKAVKIDGYTITCNDKKILTFPDENIFIWEKGFLVIKFDKNINNLEIDSDDYLYVKPGKSIKAKPFPERVKIDPKKIKRKMDFKVFPIIQQRSPGYCALFKEGKITASNLVDYVSWGRDYESKKEFFNKKYRKWAKEKVLWDGSSIFIGIDPTVGHFYCENKIAIERKSFNKSKDLSECWRTESIDEATPGKGNPWAPPNPLHLGSQIIGEKLEISVFRLDYDNRIEQFMKYDEIKIRLQIAKDPHFEEIIYNKLIPAETSINDYDFKEGIYFARIRIDTDKITSNWSETSIFEYEKE